jgi:hypothetical protein
LIIALRRRANRYRINPILVTGLDEQPRDDPEGDRDLVNIARLQFGEKVSAIHLPAAAGSFGASEATTFSNITTLITY